MTTDKTSPVPYEHHHHCFVCTPCEAGGLGVRFVLDGEGAARGAWTAEKRFQSHDGVLHGGIIAALLDSAMVHCLLLEGISALTGRLSVRYFSPVRIGTKVTLEARIDRRTGRLFVMSARAMDGGKVLAAAEGRLMRNGQSD